MALTYGFYNSVDGDRKYDAIQLGQMFDGVILDGVFKNYKDGLEVVANSDGTGIIVKKGRAWFNHSWLLNDANYPMVLLGPDPVYNRIDAVCINTNLGARGNDIVIIPGTPDSHPIPPGMDQSETYGMYPLAYILMEAGRTTISSASITDMRGTNLCPYAVSANDTFDSSTLEKKCNKLQSDLSTLDSTVNGSNGVKATANTAKATATTAKNKADELSIVLLGEDGTGESSGCTKSQARYAADQISVLRGEINTLDTYVKGTTKTKQIQYQINDLKTKVNTAQSTANGAQTTATTANNTANSASTAASTAQSTANTAKTTATKANNTANSLKTTLLGSDGKGTSTDCVKYKAETALTNANNALQGVSTLNTGLTNLSNQTIGSGSTSLATRLGTAERNISNLSSSVSTNTNSINVLRSDILTTQNAVVAVQGSLNTLDDTVNNSKTGVKKVANDALTKANSAISTNTAQQGQIEGNHQDITALQNAVNQLNSRLDSIGAFVSEWQDGDDYILDDYSASGVVTSSGKKIRFTIGTCKRIPPDIKTITISDRDASQGQTSKIVIRGVNGYVFDGSSSWLSTFNVNIYRRYSHIYVEISKKDDSAFNVTNNTVLNVWISNSKVTFSS